MKYVKNRIAGSLLGEEAEEPPGYFRGRPVQGPGGGGAGFNPHNLRFDEPPPRNYKGNYELWKKNPLSSPTFSLAAVEEARKKKEQEEKEAAEGAGALNNSLLKAFGSMGPGGGGGGGGGSTRKNRKKRKNRKTRKQRKQRKQRKGTRRSRR